MATRYTEGLRGSTFAPRATMLCHNCGAVVYRNSGLKRDTDGTVYSEAHCWVCGTTWTGKRLEDPGATEGGE